nr:hypothetical protein [Endozoicomonas sp.]
MGINIQFSPNNSLPQYHPNSLPQYHPFEPHDKNSHNKSKSSKRTPELIGDNLSQTSARKNLAEHKVSPIFPKDAETPLLKHERLLGMMMPERKKTASKEKRKQVERPENMQTNKKSDEIEMSDSDLEEMFDDNSELFLKIGETPDISYLKFDKDLSQNLQKIREGNGKKATQELKSYFSDSAHNFVSPDQEKASFNFTEYVRRVYQLDQKMEAGMPAKGELVKHAIEQMTVKMKMLTDEVRTACISEAFSNPTFKDALEKVKSDTDKSLLRKLQALSAFNFMSNEVNTLAKDSGVSLPPVPDRGDSGLDSDEPNSDTEDTNEPAAASSKTIAETGNHKKNQGRPEDGKPCLSSHLSALKRKQKEETKKNMEEFDKLLEDTSEFLEQEKNKQEEKKTEPKSIIQKVETKPKSAVSKPPVVGEKPKPVITGATKTYPSMTEIRTLKNDIKIADAVLKFVENCKNERERKELDKFLEERCTEKSKTIVRDLNQVKQQSMHPRESVKRFSETVGYRQIAETIAPPSSRKLAEISENEKVPGKDGNIVGTLLHLLKQSVVFPESLSVEGDPAKWTRKEFLAEFEKGASRYSESQRQCVRQYADDILRLFKLKQYPFGWGYDGERKASPADEEFELMATVMYDRFIGKPLFDYRDVKRLKLFTDQQRHQFLITLFGEKELSTLKQLVAEGTRTKEQLPSESIERARVCHVKAMVIALHYEKSKGQYFLVLGKRNKGQASPVKVVNRLAIECLNQKKGSNCIYREMGLPIISDNWNAVR